MSRPRIAVTMGDPAGIGPEVCLQLLAADSVHRQCTPIIFGDADILNRVAAHIGLHTQRLIYETISADEWPSVCHRVTEPAVLDLKAIAAHTVQPRVVNKTTGGAAYRYIEASIEAALAGQVDAVTTGPIHKKALSAAGISYPGHTEIYASKTNSERTCMMLTCNELTCAFATTHVGYRDVPRLLSKQRVLDAIELSHEAMALLRGGSPKLVVCGLNPHAGEDGLFGGGEEERIILPAVEEARAKGINIEGPIPPDTAFLPTRRLETDCFICMYHDQGHIPLKALAFDVAVNVTLGLPIIRTSVDHGTALDIAWQGKADPTSLIQAVSLATKLANSKVAV